MWDSPLQASWNSNPCLCPWGQSTIPAGLGNAECYGDEEANCVKLLFDCFCEVSFENRTG